MEITEVRVYSKESKDGDGKLKAFVTITLDNSFVIRDLKIIDGKKGLFVAMPSVKITAPCHKCRKKNALRSRFCNDCGAKLEGIEAVASVKFGPESQREEHKDIAHPINTETRDYIQKSVLDAYAKEIGKPIVAAPSEEVFPQEEVVPEKKEVVSEAAVPQKEVVTAPTSPDKSASEYEDGTSDMDDYQ